MNILVVCQYYYPEQFRITDICENLQKNGNNVTVVAGIPNYPEGEIFPGYEESYKEPEIHNGVKIIRCNNRPRHKGIKNLALNYLTYVLEASKVLKKMKDSYDVVYVYQLSPITMAIPAIRFAKKRKIPLYLYCLDLWPESIRDSIGDNSMNEKSLIFKVVRAFSKKIYQSANLIGVKCEAFADYLIDVCSVKKENIKVLYEHAEDLYLSVPETPDDNGCFDFAFLGNIGSAQNCEIILKAMKRFETEKEYKVHFVGDGSALDDLKKLSEELELQDKVVFHGRCPISEVGKFYELADCCLLTLKEGNATSFTPPGKMYGYMAAARPIISSASNVVNFELEKIGCGIGTNSDDITSLANAMQYAIDNPAELLAMGIKGREYFKENYTIDKHLEGLEAHFKKICTDK